MIKGRVARCKPTIARLWKDSLFQENEVQNQNSGILIEILRFDAAFIAWLVPMYLPEVPVDRQSDRMNE